jgi:hypothetical protein
MKKYYLKLILYKTQSYYDNVSVIAETFDWSEAGFYIFKIDHEIIATFPIAHTIISKIEDVK